MFGFETVTIGLIVDLCLISGILFLWLSWHKNGKRQQHMEQILADTAQQLEEASRHLNQATRAIEHLKQQEKERPKTTAKPEKQVAAKKSSAAAPTGSLQASTILRMQREGESAEGIAEKLGMPLAQIRLMLKLHAASNHSR